MLLMEKLTGDTLKKAVGPVVVPQGENCSVIYIQIMKEHVNSKVLRDKPLITNDFIRS